DPLWQGARSRWRAVGHGQPWFQLGLLRQAEHVRRRAEHPFLADFPDHGSSWPTVAESSRPPPGWNWCRGWKQSARPDGRRPGYEPAVLLRRPPTQQRLGPRTRWERIPGQVLRPLPPQRKVLVVSLGPPARPAHTARLPR